MMNEPSGSPSAHGTKFPGLFAALASEFHPDEVKKRSQSGKTMHYITARTAMNRLDEVLGPENWWDGYVPGEHSVMCSLSIRLPDGQVLTKADAGGYAGMADPGDDDKSGFADAFKRAAVKFGVGRYLYRDGIPQFAGEVPAGREEEPEPAPEAAKPTARPKDHLKSGCFESWLPAFISWANSAFNAKRPELGGSFVLFNRGGFVGALLDAFIGMSMIPAEIRDAGEKDQLAGLGHVFDGDPAEFHKLAIGILGDRAERAKSLKKGLKQAS
jgi:hypothetical protein